VRDQPRSDARECIRRAGKIIENTAVAKSRRAISERFKGQSPKSNQWLLNHRLGNRIGPSLAMARAPPAIGASQLLAAWAMQ